VSHKIHKSDLIKHEYKNSWLSPEFLDTKPNLNGVLNRIYHSIKLLNFILTERDKRVNEYREKMEKHEKLEDTFWYLILLTESYFTYAKNVLNAYAELIFQIKGNYPDSTNGDFTKLRDHVQKNETQDAKLKDFFNNKTKWYELLIQLPRNRLVIHDSSTEGYVMNDHEIDIYIGKHPKHDPDKSKAGLKLLDKIISKHSEFANMRVDDFPPVFRQIVEKIDILSEKEIRTLVNASGIAGFDFPYIPQTTPKIQEFINFIDGWLKIKFQTCPQCSQPNLQVTRMAINPDILKSDPQNIWFGWKCTSCTYRRKFNL
jgi:hypothetical protein